MGEYKPDGTLIREYIWIDDALVATRSAHAGQDFQYVLTDHLNTPRAVVLPSTNAIVWRWDLTGSAFGDHAAQDNPDGDTAAFTFNVRYPGQYFDSETGLHYNYFRDYDPGTGRYVQSDPIGLGGGISTFGYVSGSPFGGSDPYGLLAPPEKPLAPGVGSGALVRKLGWVGLSAYVGWEAGSALYPLVEEPLGDAIDATVEACADRPKCQDPSVENIRGVMTSSDMNTVNYSVSQGFVAAYVADIQAGIPLSPIRISNGDLIIDGNHRYLAARLCFFEAPSVDWGPNLTTNYRPIASIRIDP